MFHSAPSPNRGWRIATEAVVALAGIAALAGTLFAGDDWLARHFPPDFRVSYASLQTAFLVGRIILGGAGVALLVAVRPRIGRLVARGAGLKLVATLASIVLAIAMALGASEIVLRTMAWNAKENRHPANEPISQPDARLGWVFKPSRTGYRSHGGRTIAYSFDAFGYRRPDARAKLDFDRPTIIFAGESLMMGYALPWAESIPAQVGSMLHVQVANISVDGHATDQIYLRLKTELPRFRRPVGVVILFTPMLFGRNIDKDRPHLAPDLSWHPPTERWRLTGLARRLVPYRGDREIRSAVAMTRAALRAGVGISQARGATAIVLVPQFMPETPAERRVRAQVLGGSNLPYVVVPLNPAWRVPADWHPDARAAHVMATAIASQFSMIRQSSH